MPSWIRSNSSAAIAMRSRGSPSSTTEQQAVADHIPWTRVVAERKTEFRSQPIDLVPYILEHRDRFVLKPNDEYGGKGIVLGWTVDQAAWESSVRAALTEPFVV